MIVTGFLGAGKTSLLNCLIRQCGSIRAAALVNDFGAVNVDARLVVGLEGTVYGIANGCVCCALRDDLVASCLGIVKDFGRPDVLFVETSGVSNALEVANTFLRPQMRNLLQVSAIVGVVDAFNFGRIDTELRPLAWAQVSVADILVLNKVDCVGAKELAHVRDALARAAPRTLIFEACHGQLPLDIVISRTETAPARASYAISCEKPGDVALTSLVWQETRPLGLSSLRAAFDNLPCPVYRAKGFVWLDELPTQRIHLQMVGSRSSLTAHGGWSEGEQKTQIVMIGPSDRFDPAAMYAVLNDCIADADARPSPLKALAALLPALSRQHAL